MLKIAEYNTITGEKVELEELKKYGYEYDEDDGFLGRFITPHYEKNFDYYNRIRIYVEDRILRATHDDTISISDEEILKNGWIDDLQKDGFIIKEG